MRRKMKDLPEEMRPYEKCFLKGTCSLSDNELLAVIIRTGFKGERSLDLAEKILNFRGNQKGLLNINQLNINELTTIKGIGKVKAAQIKCISELSRRIVRTSMGIKPIFTSPNSIANYYMEELRYENKENLILLMLNTKNMLIKEEVVSIGTINAAFISPREIFILALQHQAVHIILIHNHPSGNPKPSNEDISSTKKIMEIGKTIGIPLLDHIIIGDNKYFSLKEEGLI